MTNSQIELEISRLKMRAEIHEVLILHTGLLLPLTKLGVSLRETEQMLLKALEDTAKTLENQFLTSPQYQDMTDSERALYADEFREVVEHMKTSVGLLADGMAKVLS